jgi:hypothetical protein
LVKVVTVFRDDRLIAVYFKSPAATFHPIGLPDRKNSAYRGVLIECVRVSPVPRHGAWSDIVKTANLDDPLATLDAPRQAGTGLQVPTTVMLATTGCREHILKRIDDVAPGYATRSAHREDALPGFVVTSLLVTGWANTTLEHQEFPDELMRVFPFPAIVELKREAAIAIKPVSHG